jgi:type I restriction enzyme S subunit
MSFALPAALSQLKPNPDWAELPLFNRKNWARFRFGEVVENVNERVEPGNAAEEIYVGLDDLDSGSLHLRRWGKGSDVTGTKLRFRNGDIIFGRRRAYQRKLVVAEFDGICSAHAMVARAKPAVVLPEFLPFLMMSDRFMQRAVEISVGSLSPTINWTTLKLEEFDLPSLDQQRRIAEILWAVDEAVKNSGANLATLSSLKQVAMEEYTMFGKPLKSGEAKQSRYAMRHLGHVAACQYGLSCPLSESGTYPILRMMNYDEELVAATDLKYADMPADVASEFELGKGDILFNRTNSADLVGKVGIFNLEECYLFASYLVRVKTDRAVLLPEFLNYYLNSPHGQTSVRAFATPGVSQSNISAGNLKKVEVPVPPLPHQETVVEKLNEIAAAHRTCRAHEATQRALLLTLINAISGEQS